MSKGLRISVMVSKINWNAHKMWDLRCACGINAEQDHLVYVTDLFVPFDETARSKMIHRFVQEHQTEEPPVIWWDNYGVYPTTDQVAMLDDALNELVSLYAGCDKDRLDLHGHRFRWSDGRLCDNQYLIVDCAKYCF